MRKEVTCKCSVYPFSHRIGGGKCHGIEWAESIYLHKSTHCNQCRSNAGTECQVASGLEDIEECPEYQDRLEGRQAEMYPLNEEAMLDEYYV